MTGRLSLLACLLAIVSSLFGAEVALAQASISTDPSSLTFGVQALGSRSAEVPVTVVNTGAEPVTVTASISGTNGLEFALPEDGCRALTLEPGGSCQVTVVFRPVAGGTKSASLLFAGPASASVPLLGNPNGLAARACGTSGQPPCDPTAACLVPRLRGLTIARAKRALRRARCRPGRISGRACPSSRPRCTRVVTRQGRRPRGVAPSGTRVGFTANPR